MKYIDITENNLKRGGYVSSICLSVLYCMVISFVSQPVIAEDWWDNFESQTGFSEFAPPSNNHNSSSIHANQDWRSGTSFKHRDQVKFKQMPSNVKRNPWKPVHRSNYNGKFSGQRPWGNVPESRPKKIQTMRFHDQRFKDWSHKNDANYHNSFMRTNVAPGFVDFTPPYASNYAYPGVLHNYPLLSPLSVPISGAGFAPYNAYPAAHYPYTNFPGRFMRW